jgi:hypothetical protein
MIGHLQREFERTFQEAVASLSARGYDDEELCDVLEDSWFNGDWSSPSLGERLNTLNEALGGHFEERLEQLRAEIAGRSTEDETP